MYNISQVRRGPLENSEYVVPFRMHYIQNGISKTWDLIQSHPSVSVIIYNTSRDVLVCVKQFRPGVYLNSIPQSDKLDSIDIIKYPPLLGITLEFCAGIVDKNKSLESIAVEEIFEECGYEVDPSKLEKITSFRCSVGTSGDFQTMYYVEVDDSMRVGQGGGVDAEFIEVVDISLDEGRQILESPSPTVPAEFLYGLLWFYHNKSQGTKKKISK